MIKLIRMALVACLCVAVTLSQAAAFRPQDSDLSAFGVGPQRPAGYAGVYLRLGLNGPIGGGGQPRLSYGIAAGLQQYGGWSRRASSPSTALAHRQLAAGSVYGPVQPVRVDLLRFGFTQHGFDRVDLLGAPVVMGPVYGADGGLDGFGRQQGGFPIGLAIAGGLAVLAGFVVVEGARSGGRAAGDAIGSILSGGQDSAGS